MMSFVLDKSENVSLTNTRKIKSFEDIRITTGETMMPRRLSQCLKIALIITTIAVIFLIIAALTSAGDRMAEIINFKHISQSSDSTHASFKVGNVTFDQQDNSIKFQHAHKANKKTYLSIKVKVKVTGENGLSLVGMKESAKVKTNGECLKTVGNNQNHVLCLDFSNYLNAAIHEENFSGTDCLVVQWVSTSNYTTTIEQCIDLVDNWYGGGALTKHRWPLNRVNVPMQAYITRKFNSSSLNSAKAQFESYLEPYFVSANGVAIILDSFLPLFISINDNNNQKLCFKGMAHKPYYLKMTTSDQTLLKYKVCKGNTAKAIHETLLKSQLLDHPFTNPSKDVLQKPVWSTRGIHLQNVNEMQLLKYISSLKSSNLSFSQLFIDGNYSRSPGSVYFNQKKFPHSAQLAMELDFNAPVKKLKLATEVFPRLPKFIVSSNNFSFQNDKTSTGEAAFLDVSNEDAVQWFSSQLSNVMKEVRVKGFRFSGGHAASPLEKLDSMQNLGMKTLLHPNEITHKYGEIAGNFQGTSFLGSGYKSQKYGLVADAGPFLARWDHSKGLKSIIPTVITYGIMGYPFVSAGPVGGVSHHLNSSSGSFSLSERNLYVRWLQLTSFLPVVEFSVGPWQYDTQVLNHARALLAYRQDKLWPEYLSSAIREATETGVPIIRPLWWIAPHDKTAQFIDCEFMLGDGLLVAPVLDSNQLGRQVYLPKGSWWQDQLRGGKVYKGGQWLSNYGVGEFEVAHFVRRPLSSSGEHLSLMKAR